MVKVNVIGGGLAGTEAAWQLAERGFEVVLYEMRPRKTTGAHVSDRLAELVCSNSLGSKLPDRASGLLQAEVKVLNSLLMSCADAAAVPAGGALAVDREEFAECVTKQINEHPLIKVVREEVTTIPEEPTIIATGPLTSNALAEAIGQLTGQEYLYFYDAIAPIVSASSIDMSIAFRASRYDRGDTEDGDYINCPMSEEEYTRFVNALLAAERAELRDFELEDPQFFERCVPIEHLAERGFTTLAFGPMRPVGLRDPGLVNALMQLFNYDRTTLLAVCIILLGSKPISGGVNKRKSCVLSRGWRVLNLSVWGQMHRNTFINSPALLESTMKFRQEPPLYLLDKLPALKDMWGTLRQVSWRRSTWQGNSMAKLNGYCHKPRCWVRFAIMSLMPNQSISKPMKANFGILPELYAES